jgi:hypothetical protein
MPEISSEPVWWRSKRCGSQACVEVARLTGTFLVRDAASPDGSKLSFTAADWAAFVTELRTGSLDRPSA